MIHVAVGVILNSSNQVLIAQRPGDKYKGGLWEFPGGKVEVGESVQQALQRELMEELAIEVVIAEPWMQLEYDYNDRMVFLDVWFVHKYMNEPVGAEGQPLRWVDITQLKDFDFPAGNKIILEKLSAYI